MDDNDRNGKEYADQPRNSIISTTSSRQSTSGGTIVHVHPQTPLKIMPINHQDASIKQTPYSVVFHENPFTSYHTIIKVLTRLTPMMHVPCVSKHTQNSSMPVIACILIQLLFTFEL